MSTNYQLIDPYKKHSCLFNLSGKDLKHLIIAMYYYGTQQDCSKDEIEELVSNFVKESITISVEEKFVLNGDGCGYDNQCEVYATGYIVHLKRNESLFTHLTFIKNRDLTKSELTGIELYKKLLYKNVPIKSAIKR